jgi:hypothetical protein
MKARKSGVTKFERPLIIRETVLFFLSLKYWWSSSDYDRITEFLGEYFPDLKDPLISSDERPSVSQRSVRWSFWLLWLLWSFPSSGFLVLWSFILFFIYLFIYFILFIFFTFFS